MNPNIRPPQGGGTPPAKAAATAVPKTPPAPLPAQPHVPPLFRRLDWLTMLIGFALVWVIYFICLAPQVTLEDSGELCTASYWAGHTASARIPVLDHLHLGVDDPVPFKNIAWRVALAEASTAAAGCGLVALMVSRGSSMLMEGIEDLKNMTGKWESAICMVSGIVAALMLGLGSSMWKESVVINRISLFGVPWLLLVLTLMLRWNYAPHQRRYLYIAFFFIGVCATIHQTLSLAIMGLQIGVASRHPKLGRDMFFFNSVAYIVMFIANMAHTAGLLDVTNEMVFIIFNAVGICSIIACIALSIKTNGLLTEWKSAGLSFLLIIGGACFYFYEAVSGMTNPPMEWGYPRTVEGFWHALTRGQYDRLNPTNIFKEPMHFSTELNMLFSGLADAYSLVAMFFALLPLLFIFKMQKRERSWIISVAAVYPFLGVLLSIFLNPSRDRQTSELVKVFFTASHGVFAIMIGYGMALIASYMATHYGKFRRWAFTGAAVAIALALYSLYTMTRENFFGLTFTPLHSGEAFFLGCANAIALAIIVTYIKPIMERIFQSAAVTTCLIGYCFAAIITLLWFVWAAQALPGWSTSHIQALGEVLSNEGAAFLVGFALAFTIAFAAANYERFARTGLIWTGIAAVAAFCWLWRQAAGDEMPVSRLPHWILQAFAPHQYGSPVYAGLLLLGMTLVFLVALIVYRQRSPLAITLGLFALMPVYSGASHWFKSEQRNHWFGYWFGHDMFTPPFVGPDNKLTYDAKLRDAAAKGPYGKMVYTEMARDAVLFGGTDPGRFCPTYMIFCESFIPHHCQPEQDQNYDRRDVYIITQNALADNTYLDYIRAQFNRSAQIDPPFFQNFLSGSPITSKFVHGPVRSLKWLDDIFEGLGARVERERADGTSRFKPDQFLSAQKLAAKLRHGSSDPLSQFLYSNLSPETKQLVDSSAGETALRNAFSKDLNTILLNGNIYSPDRFKNIKLPPLIQDVVPSPNLTANNILRLNRRMLEEAYPDAIVKSLGGVYPDTEIATPSADDSRMCFDEYMADVQRRLQHDQEFPNEHRQVHPGEVVGVENGKMQVAGQTAVMSINGLLTKVIFDKNPLHEFYVEESFPLDWMYPHLEPFGVIMKINRHPVREMSQETIDRDHAFWCEFSRRTIGNWITYDTTVKQVCDWVEEVYLRHDFTHFTGDRAFIRDDDAQKAFSKLRSSIASSIYLWRSKGENSLSAGERPRVAREADFALKQAFAYCPYSPEAVFHYAIDQLVIQSSPPRIEDALLVLRTCRKLDPYNTQITENIEQLERTKHSPPLGEQIKQVFNQIQSAIASGHTNEASRILSQVLGFAGTDPNTLMNAAQCYAAMGDLANSEKMVTHLTEVVPDKTESWYNLATIQTFRAEYAQALVSLKKSLEISDAERKTNPHAFDIRKHMFEDPALAALRQTPDFQAAYGTKP